MEIGTKIFELRKQNNLSQEKLAELVGVSRQTISKWELGETSPDIKQAKRLAEIFRVSLDQLVGNDTHNVILEKVSNTEKLAGLVIKILKGIGVCLLLLVVCVILSLVRFSAEPQSSVVYEKAVLTIEESLGEEFYTIQIGDDGTFVCNGISDEMESEISQLIDYDDLEGTEERITQYFQEKRDAM